MVLHTNYSQRGLQLDSTPWTNKAVQATAGVSVRGEARSEDQAVQMIHTGMEKSEGWSGRRGA
jgi:hypothetical protein